MLQVERMQRIQNIINDKNFISVDDLCEEFNVSKATIRRDLNELENEGKIIRTHGGAIGNSNLKEIDETPYSVASKVSLEEKKRIGIAAAKHINPGNSVIFDSGTTVIKAAERLVTTTKQEFIAATHDLIVAMELSKNPNIDLTVVGGTKRKGFYALTGHLTQYMLSKMQVDVAFMGFDALSPQLGCMNFCSEEVTLKKQIIKISKQKIVLCDHTKFSSVAQFVVCGFNDIDLIITGKELDNQIVDQIKSLGVKLELV